MKAVSAKELIAKVVQKFADIGTVYSAAWTASSSSGNFTHLTGSITLPPGTYVATITTPIASAALLMCIVSGPPYYFLSSQQVATQILHITSTTTIWVSSAASTSVTFSYLDRGSLKVVRIA